MHPLVDTEHLWSEIHQAGFVHGDIRQANIVYGLGTGTLIDFDFADREGSCYPEFYSSLVNL